MSILSASGDGLAGIRREELCATNTYRSRNACGVGEEQVVVWLSDGEKWIREKQLVALARETLRRRKKEGTPVLGTAPNSRNVAGAWLVRAYCSRSSSSTCSGLPVVGLVRKFKFCPSYTEYTI